MLEIVLTQQPYQLSSWTTPLINPSSRLTSHLDNFTPNISLQMFKENNPPTKFTIITRSQKNAVLRIFNLRTNIGPISQITPRILATSTESLMMVLSSRYQT